MSLKSRWFYISSTPQSERMNQYKIGISNKINRRMAASKASFPPIQKTESEYIKIQQIRPCSDEIAVELGRYIADFFSEYGVHTSDDDSEWYELEHFKLIIKFDEFIQSKLIYKYIIEKFCNFHQIFQTIQTIIQKINPFKS